jgi:hypothetical protein
MADELQITISNFAFSKVGSPTVSRNWGQLLVDVAGKTSLHTLQTIGISEEALIKGEVGTAGWIAIKNLDDTNFVEVGTTGKLAAKLKPGEYSAFRLSGDPYAQANVANVDIEYILVED